MLSQLIRSDLKRLRMGVIFRRRKKVHVRVKEINALLQSCTTERLSIQFTF